ncbi:hypothetical protein C2869_00540 [Saccharobesus litoralis]|uniref:Carboxypeptidase regulatory-like domain-containing protein n=1 Tax=Saccharobesus litoralis TaxID=2172099 RepID=A0A2S0VLC7_9ALTE|nr:hypothetical protein [Saccharobesus litoralis]AWB65019.1 hypothetical protein C2869_00540 [Saccharobesus litoralis]
MLNSLKILCLIIATSLLSACDEPGPSTQVIGSVNKGIVVNGQVDVYEVAVDGVIGSEIKATGSTDEMGRFIMDVPLPEGVRLYVKLTANPQGTSKMLCDLPTCSGSSTDAQGNIIRHSVIMGQWLPLPDTFILSAFVSEVKVGESVNINILTHSVAQKYQEQAPDKAQLENEYLQLKQELNLNRLPNEIEPLSPTEDNVVDDANIQDNLLVLAALQTIEQADNITNKVANFVEHFQQNESVVTEHTSLSEITATAVSLAEPLITSTNIGVSEGVDMASLERELQSANIVAAKKENRLPMADLPISPPNL